MRTLIAFLTALLATANSFAQKTVPNEYPAWEQPVIKKLIAKSPSVIGYGVKNNDKWVNIAILDKKPKTLYWITCEGFIIEAARLTDYDYNLLVSKKTDPFRLYHLLYERDLQITDDVIGKCRFPKQKFHSAANPNYDAYIYQILHAKEYDTLKTPLKKLAALLKKQQQYLYHIARAEIRHPSQAPNSIVTNDLPHIATGSITVSEHTDSSGTAEFYNKDVFSPICKAVLNIATAKLYFYRRNQTVFDSIAINRKQILKLIHEGTDVFTLYQHYTIWQLIRLDNMAKQLHEYYTNRKANPKQKKATDILLAGYSGGKEELVQQMRAAEASVLTKLNYLFGADKQYLEQDLWNTLAFETELTRQGQYHEDKGLIISAPEKLYSPTVFKTHTVTRGNKRYQLTDHRGNVVAVITDRKIQHDDNGDGIVDYYTAEVVKVTDYSSFGAPLPGRTFEMADYRYGYNGKENDVETGYQDYGFRMYDPNIGRFISVDPLTKKYPMLAPYQFASNSPIAAIDLDGLEGFMAMPNEQGNRLNNATADVIKAKIFKSTFSHYLPKKFIDLYSNGQGTPYRLSQKETQDLHVAYTGFHGITENDNARATDFLNSINPGESMELPEGYSITGAAMNAGTLGRFQIRLKGKVTKDKDDNFSFEGQMQYYDTYDFKTTKTKEGDLQRSDWGDLQTDFADKNLNGKGFEITSDWIAIKQENSNYFNYFNGKSEEVIMNKMADKSKVTREVKKANSENKQ